MSDYRRLISYLYSYNNGVKSKNVGFAKTERKGGTVKLWINMKGAFAPEESFRVYFFVRRDNLITGIDMGECVIRGGVGQFYSARREDELTVAFDELCGLYIMGNNRGKIFASQWDDRDFSVERIVLLDDILKKNESEDKNADAEVKDIPIWQRPIREVYISGDTKTGNEKQVVQAREQQTSELQTSEQQTSEQQNPVIQEQEFQGQLHASEEAASAYKTENEALSDARERDMLFDGKEPVLAFSEDEIYDCVDIDLAEIAKLPKEARNLMNNSFVNHGYFNFHHLLLGKKDDNMLVVGVPGVYNRREKMTANMLGFEKFKFSMRPDVKMNHFGYWYKEYMV